MHRFANAWRRPAAWATWCWLALSLGACDRSPPVAVESADRWATDRATNRATDWATDWAARRRQMVDEQLTPPDRNIKNERVLAAMRKVPRHEFVPEKQRDSAYEDRALPIGHQQTISQPFIVAFMTEAVNPQKEHRVLEVGTGSGYQAAVLAELVKEVYTIELLEPLAEEATARLKRLGYKNVFAKQGDGYLGWPDKAPFDSIVVTCGAEHVPEPLFKQLKPGGVMIIPVDDKDWGQMLRVVTKTMKGERQERKDLPVRFVPLVRPREAKP